MEAETQANLVDDLVGVLGVDEVLNCASTRFAEIEWMDLNDVCKRYLDTNQNVAQKSNTGPYK